MNGEIVTAEVPPAGAMIRSDFSGNEMTTMAETASTAIAAQARAQVESRYIVAMKRPRDWDNVRVALLKECARPGFAKVARYSLPRGNKKVEGPTIRFAEAALRCMTNVVPEASAIYDDAQKRIVRVSVTDLEGNVTYNKDVVIEKTVERSFLKEGQEPLSVRVNSQGRKTYLVAATDDDLLNKENALVSKALRTQALRLLPGDILEECMDQVQATVKNSDAKDPDAAKKKIADGFARLNVTPAQLKDYLGHELAQCTPAEIAELRALWNALDEGTVTWADAMEHKRGEREAGTPQEIAAAAEAERSKRGNAGLKAQVNKSTQQAAAHQSSPVVVPGPKQAEIPMGDKAEG